MPMPKPHKNETQEKFIERFMGDPVMVKDYPDEKQRYAIALEQWKNKEFSLNDNFEERQVFDVENVPIFKVGTWNGEKYSESDLDEMVKSFMEIGKEVKPYLKLGHDNNQKLVQTDGLPAAGWITQLHRIGDTLYAKLSNVPKKIKELIDTRAYGRFSSEIYHNLREGGKNYPRVLKAVALLGADTPAVGTLDDFINLYTTENNFDKLMILNEYMEDIMSDIDVKRYEQEIEELKTFKIKSEELENKTKSLESENAELKKFIADQKKEVHEKEVKSFIDSAVESGKILPSQVGIIQELCSDYESLKVYKKEDGSEKKGTTLDMLKEFVSNLQPSVDFSQKSEHQEIDKTEKDEDIELDKKIWKYAKDNNISYREAYSVVANEVK